MYRLKKRVLNPWERRWFHVVSVVLWLTGIIWLYLRYFTDFQNAFGSSASTIVLKIHGAAAMVFLVILGALIHHMRLGWRRKRQRPSGSSLVIVCGILVLTGWGLYYAGEERFRNWMSGMHVILGLLLPAIIVFHVWNVYRKSRTTEKKSGSKH